MRSSHEIAGQVIIYLNTELEMPEVAIQKYLNLLHDNLDLNSKNLFHN